MKASVEEKAVCMLPTSAICPSHTALAPKQIPGIVTVRAGCLGFVTALGKHRASSVWKCALRMQRCSSTSHCHGGLGARCMMHAMAARPAGVCIASMSKATACAGLGTRLTSARSSSGLWSIPAQSYPKTLLCAR